MAKCAPELLSKLRTVEDWELPLRNSPRQKTQQQKKNTAKPTTPGLTLHRAHAPLTQSNTQQKNTKKALRKSSTNRIAKTGKNALSRSASASLVRKTALARVARQTPKGPEGLYAQHLFQTFQAMNFIRTLREPKEQEILSRLVVLARAPSHEHRKTVVFDLDETLVHCVQDPNRGQFTVKVALPTGEAALVGLNVRPFAREVLESAGKDFEVIVFTASHKCYADRAIEVLDPQGLLIHHRLYRESCVVVDGVPVKDLRILGDRNTAEIVIVDNSAYSFAYQVDQGIPIISWYDDPSDRELFKLIDYLKLIAGTEDLKQLNRRTFKLHSFYDDYLKEMNLGKENK